MRFFLLLLTLATGAATLSANEIALAPEKVPNVVADRQDMQIPDCVHLSGMLGVRIHNSAANRLLAVDVDRLLEGYRKRPGRQTWDGEHVGKWLHAATLAWANTGNADLRVKLDRTAGELIKCQLDDGYLGTYLPEQRWTEWDVWAHKYNLIGLITYMRYTGDMTALPACCKMGDLLCNSFGDVPGKLDILKAGDHVGMAPTSVLEPMVWLYRLSGDEKYREFCEYLLRAWEQPNGPHIVSRLLETKRVDSVGNGKSYEMLSCINGLLEWYRMTGDPTLLTAAINAWEDIVAKRQYITGAVSVQDHFRDDYVLPNIQGAYGDPNAGGSENCDTITWLQLNAHLLRLTGEARFADQLERVTYNQMIAAQRPDGRAWADLTALEGKRPYAQESISCCLSSGPRGLALIPTFAVTADADGAVVNFYDAGTASLRLRDGTAVELGIESQYPASGKIIISVDPTGDVAKREFAVRLRIPEWCRAATAQINGKAAEADLSAGRYAVIRRPWMRGDKIELCLMLEPRVVVGDHANKGKVALLRGPLVLAADEALLNDKVKDINALAIASTDPAKLGLVSEAAPQEFKTWPNAQVFRVNVEAGENMSGTTGSPLSVPLIPFADAGSTGKSYKVWFPLVSRVHAPVPLIFDTDMGNDVDDALALGLIHALQSQDECKLLAVTVTKDNRYAAPFVDVVNTFYGRGEIPIGVVRGGFTPEDSKFIQVPCTAEDDGKPRYPHKLQDGGDAPEATGLLRKVLAGQPDGSVVIVQVGFSTNLARLLDSKPDEASPLDGMALVKQKVRLLCPMAGQFVPPASVQRYAEYNVVIDVKSAQQVFERWPTPIVASGYEIGKAILYPARSIEQDYNYVPHHPVADAYKTFQKMPYDRPTWDLTSVLYAVRPEAGYFGLSPEGRIIVENDGVMQFQTEPSGPHRYMTLTPEQAARVLEEFIRLCSRKP